MSALKLLRNFLDEYHIRYETKRSRQQPNNGMKTVSTYLIHMDSIYAICVINPSEKLDLALIKATFGAHSLKLMSELERQTMFPTSDEYAVLVLKNNGAVRIVCSRKVLNQKNICLSTGEDDFIQLATDDFIRLTRPTVGSISIEV